jgi:hypothetical protein
VKKERPDSSNTSLQSQQIVVLPSHKQMCDMEEIDRSQEKSTPRSTELQLTAAVGRGGWEGHVTRMKGIQFDRNTLRDHIRDLDVHG